MLPLLQEGTGSAKPRWLVSGAGCAGEASLPWGCLHPLLLPFQPAGEVLSWGFARVPPKRWWICRALPILECSSSAASPVAAQLFVQAVFPSLLCGERHPPAHQ